MNIVMIGAGYVGLVSGACFSEFGFRVTCVDQNRERVKSLKAGIIPIFEPGLEELVRSNLVAGRLSFTANMKEAVSNADAVFIAVGTPSRRGDGMADVSYVLQAADEISAYVRPDTGVIVKSTVPVGTTRRVGELIKGKGIRAEIISNPEFLREGSAVADFMKPDRVVVGAETERARGLMRRLYRPLSLNSSALLMTSLETAELIKYASNAFLAMKVSYINQMADLCDRVSADIGDLARGLGSDKRIGAKFLHPGPGFGGSCFPKDTRALLAMGAAAGIDLSLVKATIDANEARKVEMAERIIHWMGGDVKDKTLAVLGLTFKANTDDMREAPSLVILPKLLGAGARIKAYDPAGMKAAADLMSGVSFCINAEEAMKDADALVVLTEWNVFRAIDPLRIKELLKGRVVIDLRNVYRPKDMVKVGLTYHSIGRK